jgi:hypothetical protein
MAAEVWLLRNRMEPELNAEEGACIRAVQRVYAELTGIPPDQVPEPRDLFEIASGRKEGIQQAAVESFRRLGVVAGDAMGRIFSFPIPTYNITKDFKWDNPDYEFLWDITKKYGIPYFSTSILKINPITNTTSTFGSVAGGWIGGCLAPNGKIYAIPYDMEKTRSVLKIDPVAGTATTFGSISAATFVGDTGWIGGCLAPNGKIYSAPSGGTGILEINPEDDTVSVIGIGSIPSLGQDVNNLARWSPFILSPDGKMYAPPFSETKMLVLGETSNQEPADWLLSPYCNKGP